METKTDRGLDVKRVLFAGGGTGGHVFMAVALAEELKRRASACEVLFVGTRQGLEAKILPPLGYRLETVEIGGLNRVGLLKALLTLIRLPLTVIHGARIVRRFDPSVVVGVGGYSSGPVVLGGKLSGYRAVLIEPNAYPGLTNRWLSRWVDGAALAFEEAAGRFGARARITGIPVRQEFYAINGAVPETGPLRVLIFGGSQGSRPINNLVCEAIRLLPQEQVRIVHQTGPADCERIKAAYAQAGFKAEVRDFIQRMPEAFADTDLIIARSGASTVAEVTAAGKAAILIPFPEAADDHQRMNAAALERRQAAIMLEQADTTGAKLAELILSLARDRQRLRAMAAASRSLSQPASVDRILDLIQEVARS
jgi:UDP-N-acetylglucosamine--N-acetylmuramyl-(pentapeptide) pyrophosphoryl-undecaprenol N-acetylglucosamine transferase